MMTKDAIKEQREQVRMLAMQIGLRPAARACGLSEDRVRQWAHRYGWKFPHKLAQTDAVTSPPVTAPAEALAQVLRNHSDRTKLGLAAASTKVSEHLAKSPAEELAKPGTASAASKWSGVAAVAHGWNISQGTDVAVQINWREENEKAQELWRALRAREGEDGHPARGG